MPLHRDLPDSELHQVKGAAGAVAGTVLKANGDGTTSFVIPSSLESIKIASVLENKSSSSINPSALDTPIDATFDTTVSNTDTNIASTGIITLLKTGVYIVTLNLNFGRTSGAGTVTLAARLLLNGSPTGFVQGMSMSDTTSARPAQFNIYKKFNANDTLKVQIVRDSSGINNGGLIATATAASGWDDIPAYWVRVHKIDGAV